MKKIFLFVCTLFLASHMAFAGRVLPPDMRLAVLKKADYPDIVLSGDGWTWTQILTLGLVNNNQTEAEALGSIRIKDTYNRFITKNRLVKHIGQPVGVFFDRQGQIKEIWVLTPKEREEMKRRTQ
ncbi:hypothetical protein [Kingella potus]|nr:hypothetical protein [Kingella potus]UOP00605.1 hypothetical protein LVJ84_12415 [Kingella potus]